MKTKRPRQTGCGAAVGYSVLSGNPRVTKYVVGFMFDTGMENVALIRKQKPAWQEGLLNGIGGKVEDSESSLAAMTREFREEAGLRIIGSLWRHFCAMAGTNNDGGQFEVNFFYTLGEPHKLTSMEVEQIEVVDADDICAGREKTVGNVPWLVALARDFVRGVYPPTLVTAQYLPNAKLSHSRRPRL